MTSASRHIGKLLLVIVAFVARSPQAFGQLTESDREVLNWFSKLGYPPIERLPFVEVRQHLRKPTAGDDGHRFPAFLVSDSETSFRVFRFDLSVQDYHKRRRDESTYPSAQFDRITVSQYARQRLDDYREGRNDRRLEIRSIRRVPRRADESIELLLLAVACQENGHQQMAHDLLMSAGKRSNRSSESRRPKMSLRQALGTEIAHTIMWNATLKFGRPRVPRSEILGDLKFLVRNFPGSPHNKRAREIADQLELMVREDVKHHAPTDFESLTTNEKVTELIFQLRDQVAAKFSQPGSGEIFDRHELVPKTGLRTRQDGLPRDIDDRASSPAEQLANIGLDAVPQLIEALDDPRFSRTIGYHRHYYFSHHVRRVGDCAKMILERVAGRQFHNEQEIRDWWRHASDKGEKQTLADGVERGDRNSVDQAMRLIERYPDAAIDSISMGAKNASSGLIRNRLLSQAAQLGRSADQFLKRELSGASELTTRVTAAELLFERHREQTIRSMILEWDRVCKGTATIDPELRLVRFLCSCNDSRAIEALRSGYDQHDVEVRLNIISNLGVGGLSVGSVLHAPGHSFHAPDKHVRFSGKTRELVETLLVEAMGDTDRRPNLSITWGKYFDTNPRVCDVAGHVLQSRFPEKYQFDAMAPIVLRDEQRFTSINRWRKSNGLSLLVSSKGSRSKPLPEHVTQPLIQRILDFGHVDDRRKAIAIYERNGLRGLDAAQTTLKQLPTRHHAYSDIRQMIGRMASTVSIVDLDEKRPSLSATQAAMLTSMLHRPFDSQQLGESLSLIASNPTKNVTGVTVDLKRTSANQGITLRINVDAGKEVDSESRTTRDHDYFVAVDGHRICDSRIRHRDTFESISDLYRHFAYALEAALKSSAETTIDARFSIAIRG